MSDNIIRFPARKLSTAGAGTEPRSFGELVVADATAAAVACSAEATRESTPVIFPYVPLDVHRICPQQSGCPEILVVQVLPSPDADPRNYVENIAREMLTEGGRPVFGWRIRTSPLFVAAEFYAMHQTDTGLVDMTPNTRGEQFVVFAPDYDVPADFNVLDRPPTRRFSTYVPPTRRERVNAEMALMDRGVLACERFRAARKGLALEDALVPQARSGQTRDQPRSLYPMLRRVGEADDGGHGRPGGHRPGALRLSSGSEGDFGSAC